MQGKTRVLAVEDHEATCLGLRAFLAHHSGFELADIVFTGEDGIARARELRPDVACLDVRLAGALDGYETCRRILADRSARAVVMYTAQEEPHIVTRARAAGALGVAVKSDPKTELIRAITLAARSEPYTSARFATTCAPPLTPRQRDVLELAAEGLSNGDVAARLGISIESVKTHMAAVLKKLEANHRTQAVAIGLRHHLIE